jgi:FAD/FMN-containing dehydrogenase
MASSDPLAPDLVVDRVAAIADCSVTSDADAMVKYATDWTGRWTGAPRAVVRPRTFDAAVAAMSVCRALGVAVVPQGGNTGLVAGAVPPEGSVVISTEYLVDAGDVQDDGTVTVGAGTTLAALEAMANRSDLTCGLTLASGESATVGGAAATNAGGMRVLRHGTARARIAGLRAVTAEGTVVDRRRTLPKDNTGFDLVNLLVGSEGTLALITDVTWRLAPRVTDRIVLVFAFPDVAAAVSTLPVLRRLPGLQALEWAAGAEVQRAADHTGQAAPLPVDGFWVFAELGDAGRRTAGRGADDEIDLLGAATGMLDTVIGTSIAEDRIAVASTPAECRHLWSFRERITESINSVGVPIKLDVGVPLDVFADSFHAIEDTVRHASDEVTVALFGHLAEGNFHVNLVATRGGSIPPSLGEQLEDLVLELVLRAGGTVSAEHGIGRAKARWLPRQHGSDQVDLMRGIKAAWDPTGLLNPGVLFGGSPTR